MSEVGDGDDGLPVEVVGPWVKEKHGYLCRYLDAARGARGRFSSENTLVDLFCGFGRSKIRGTLEFIDGSPVAAWRKSTEGKAPFSRVFVADLNADCRSACVKRLKAVEAPVTALSGDALTAAVEYRRNVDPRGLHLAFLDPHSLGDLDFRIIEELAKLPNIDMLIHVSAMDMQRNLPGQLTAADAEEFERFAPDWRDKIETTGSQRDVRGRLLEYWKAKVESLGMQPFADRLIRGSQRQRLYWLMLVSRHPLAGKLWDAIGRADKQLDLL